MSDTAQSNPNLGYAYQQSTDNSQPQLLVGEVHTSREKPTFMLEIITSPQNNNNNSPLQLQQQQALDRNTLQSPPTVTKINKEETTLNNNSN